MKTFTLVVALAALGWGTVAAADEPNDRPNLVSKIGMAAEVGGGVGGFLDSRAYDMTKPQGLWTARLTVGTRSHFAGELGYIGSAQGLSTLGVDQNAYLMSNGVEGAFRLNILTGMLQPYAIAGVGYQHYSIQNTAANTSDVADSADVAEFPLGVGLAFRYAGFVADARFSLHPAANSPLLANNVPVSTWTANARIGFEF